MRRTFVGFGFGAIQTGLFLHEARQSGNFDRYVISEVVPAVVESVRGNEGACWVNVAHLDRIEKVRLDQIEIYNPNVAGDRARLVDIIAEAEELATALPSVKFYTGGGAASVDVLLAEGFGQSPYKRRVFYCAENNNHAAPILRDLFLKAGGETCADSVRFVDTVIGKMSGIVTDEAQIAEQRLARLTPEADRAILVEAFNRILISKVGLDDFRRGIDVFEEKADLLPFEEAKLYGHNATHALLAYLGAQLGLQYASDADERLRQLLTEAFVTESGGALTRKHAGVDPLFTPAGYRDYVDDLILRMTNPNLRDTIERLARDPDRKLGWEDRLIGTIRVVQSQGLRPRLYAIGAAAALMYRGLTPADGSRVAESLLAIWGDAAAPGAERDAVVDAVSAGFGELAGWIQGGKPDLLGYLSRS